MDRLDGIAERARLYLDGKNAARDVALARSRELIRYCANTIRATHRGEFDEAENLLATARQAAANMVAGLEGHADLYHAGYTQDALKEFAEASITFCLITDRPLPTPEELAVLPDTYLNGLGEAAGELRRYVLDVVRHGKVERCESMLQAMEDIYSLLVTMDYPDAVTSGLRRTTDMEGTHRELGTRLANRLRRNNAHRFADIDQMAARKIASVAMAADAVARFAGNRGAHLDRLHASRFELLDALLSFQVVLS